MTEAEITELVSTQRNYFKTGETLSVAYRIAALKKLKNTILSHENEILAALKADLGKSAHESYMCEAGLALSELTYMIKHTRKFAREKKRSYAPCTISFQKLQKTVSIWCCTDYEPLELSFSVNH